MDASSEKEILGDTSDSSTAADSLFPCCKSERASSDGSSRLSQGGNVAAIAALPPTATFRMPRETLVQLGSHFH